MYLGWLEHRKWLRARVCRYGELLSCDIHCCIVIVQDLIDMDREDERSGRTDEIHHRLHSAYCQFPDTEDVPLEKIKIIGEDEEQGSSSGESTGKETREDPKRDLCHPTLKGLPVSRLRHAVKSITFLIRLQKRGLSE